MAEHKRSLPAELLSSLHLDDLDDDIDTNTLIVGIDFGTTYSGVAFAFTAKPSEIHLVTQWPGSALSSEKCPTVICYADDNSYTWGFEAVNSDHGVRIEAVKLLLDPEQPTPLYVPAQDAGEELENLNKSATDVTTDYINALLKHALTVTASKFTKGYLETVRKKFVLTVPAVWSDKAKAATLKAAENAGISGVTLITEPEAAALYTLHFMGDKGLEVGDALVICDAGGGTVDLTAYEVINLKPFQLKELAPARGGICGSKMINIRFEEHLKWVVGEKEFVRLKGLDIYKRLMLVFDQSTKPRLFTTDASEELFQFTKAGLKDNPRKMLEENTITIKTETMKTKVFDPVIGDTRRLVNEQVKDARLKRQEHNHPKGSQIRAIFIVGGFGSNAYMCKRIKEDHQGIEVIQPINAWSAIVRGAVMCGLPREATVVSNVAPKHYGVQYLTREVDPILDAGRTVHTDPYDGSKGVDAMKWYIHKGDDLDRAKPIEFDFVMKFPDDPGPEDRQMQTVLYECGLDSAPLHPGDSLKSNCTLKTDLTILPENCFNRRLRLDDKGNMLRWKELQFKLVITSQSGPMLFSINCRGKEYGAVTTTY